MQRHKLFSAVAAAIVIGFTATVAQAQQAPGGYLGLSAGQTDPDTGDLDNGTGFRIYGGYMYNPTFGVEVGYIDGGSFDGKGVFAGSKVEADGAYVAAVGSFPTSDRVTIFGKAGFFHYDFETTRDGRTLGSTDGTELMLGVGFDYALSNSLSIGMEYDLVNDVEESDVSALWFNVRFGMSGQ
jgi:OmpA-OmpF porin, OOP family